MMDGAIFTTIHVYDFLHSKNADDTRDFLVNLENIILQQNIINVHRKMLQFRHKLKKIKILLILAKRFVIGNASKQKISLTT